MSFIDPVVKAFHQGGVPVMASITFVFFLSIVLVIERVYRYWMQYDQGNPSAFMAHIQKFVMNNSIESAIRACKNQGSQKLLPYVLAEGLKRANDSTEEIDNALDHAVLTSVPMITKNVGFLATTANVATLLGLLGTIFGLMKSFKAVATATGAQKNALLAEGISEALTATSYGLSVAMFCLLAYGLLMLKQASLVDTINKHSSRLTDLLHTRKVKLKSARS